jgi:hypothetical protein
MTDAMWLISDTLTLGKIVHKLPGMLITTEQDALRRRLVHKEREKSQLLTRLKTEQRRSSVQSNVILRLESKVRVSIDIGRSETGTGHHRATRSAGG